MLPGHCKIKSNTLWYKPTQLSGGGLREGDNSGVLAGIMGGFWG
jgi:hypothetical protein